MGHRDELTEGQSESAETIRLRSARGIRAELNYLLPEGSAEVGPTVEGWFTAATEQLAGVFMSELPAEGLPTAVLRDPEGGPFGPEGSRWCSLLVIGQRERRLSKSLRAWTPKNWEMFLAQSPDVSVEMSAKFSTLNRFGHAGVPSLTISAYRERPEAKQWLRLDASYVVGQLGATPPIPNDVSEAWRAFLVRQAEAGPPPVFGYLADDVFDANTRTPLEAMSATFPDATLPLTDSEVRGYSWVTVVSPGVVERLGGVDAIRATEAFADVLALSGGGAMLQATEHLSHYEGDAVRRVFEALGPALPDKAPWPDDFNRFKLIYEPPIRR